MENLKFNLKFYGILFLIGALGYGLLEVIWRGYTHPSMSLAGGISLCFLALIQKYLKPLRFIYRCLAGGAFITAIELLFGYVFNMVLKMEVWDYTPLPFNFLGQISLLYFVIWCFISAPMLILTDLLRQKLNSIKANDES